MGCFSSATVFAVSGAERFHVAVLVALALLRQRRPPCG
jgi:uncharacterized membrane protein YedE/YeeE